MSDHSVLKFDYKFNVVKYKTEEKLQLDKGCYDQRSEEHTSELQSR